MTETGQKKNDSLKTGILHSINRVIKHSGQPATQFYWGLTLKTVERCIEILPFILCYIWLENSLSSESTVSGAGSHYSYPVLIVSLTLFCLFLCQLGCAWLGQRQSFLGSYQIMAGYRERLLNCIRCLPLGHLYRYRAGQLADILTDDIKRVESIFTHVAADVFAAAVVPVLLLVGLLWVDWQLTLSLVASLPVAVWVLNASKQLFVRASQQKQEKFRESSGALVEFVSGIKTLRLFNRTDYWLPRLRQRFDDIRSLSMGVEAWGAGPVVSYRLILEMSLAVILVVCAMQINTGTSGQIPAALHGLLFLLLAYKLLGPLLEIAEHLTVLRYAAQSEWKIQELFTADRLPEPLQPVKPCRYDLHVNHVHFGYENETVLHDLSFTVPQGSMTAIVGPSGAGKSSVLNLLARFYDPDTGSITLGGVDLKDMGTDQLYEQLSMVFQQVQLYDATIMQNLKAGRHNASDAHIIATCKAANCDKFIQAFPKGYETRIHEGGIRLSGGERQRLSIARALLKDAPVLLLDEITSSVDPQTQYEIQTALNKLAYGRTVVMVAHRLSTVMHADQILVMDQGRIIERGSHQALLQHTGLYKSLWDAQH